MLLLLLLLLSNGLCKLFRNDVGITGWYMDEYFGSRHGLPRRYFYADCAVYVSFWKVDSVGYIVGRGVQVSCK